MTGDKNPPGFTVLFPDDLQEYIAEHREGTYQLIDVRFSAKATEIAQRRDLSRGVISGFMHCGESRSIR